VQGVDKLTDARTFVVKDETVSTSVESMEAA
jgi:hypothetical protein